MLSQVFRNQRFVTIGQSRMYRQAVKMHTINALKGDIFGRGDLTTDLLGKNKDKTVQAEIIAKSAGVLAGMAEFQWFLQKNKIKVSAHKKDGEHFKKGERIAQLSGKAKNILQTERIGLNLLQRMSGIATVTALCVQKIPTKIMLAATRKTPWGLLDKKAVLVGGGGTHRLGLWHAILIKDNHLKLAPAEELLQKAWYAEKRGAFIEIEADAPEKAAAFAKIIVQLRQKKPQTIPVILMLDNFPLTAIEKTVRAIKKIDPEILVEISGGINAENLADYAQLQNIDLLSCGFLTHSVKACDLSLNLIIPD